MPGSMTSRHVAQVFGRRAEEPSSEGCSTRGGRVTCDGGIRRRSRAGVPPDDAAGSMVSRLDRAVRASGRAPQGGPRGHDLRVRCGGAKTSRGHRVVGGTSEARSPGQTQPESPPARALLPSGSGCLGGWHAGRAAGSLAGRGPPKRRRTCHASTEGNPNRWVRGSAKTRTKTSQGSAASREASQSSCAPRLWGTAAAVASASARPSA